MSTWPKDPPWIPVSQINNNNEFRPSDGISADDMNKIISNMIYIRRHGNEVIVDTASAHVTNKTLYLQSVEV